MNNYIRNIAYVAISAVFFSFLVLLIIHPHHPEISYFGTHLYNAICFLLGLISLSGAITFLFFIRNEVRMWYLGIPLAVAIAIVTFTSLVYPAIPGSIPDYGVAVLFNSKIGQIFTYLLAPFSALFFYSLEELKGNVRIPVIIALGISILFSLFIIDILTMHDVTPSVLFYWVIGMPIIGALYLATCTGLTDPAPQRPE